jgi:hypothetical protein
MAISIFLISCIASEFFLLYVLYHFVFDGKRRRHLTGSPGKPPQLKVVCFEHAKNSQRAASSSGGREIDLQSSLQESGLTDLVTSVDGQSSHTSKISCVGSSKQTKAPASLCLGLDDPAITDDNRNCSPIRPVVVIAASRKRTVAALRAALRISRDLQTQLKLVAVTVVPGKFPLHEPWHSVATSERKLRHLVDEAGIPEHKVRIQVATCRHWRVGVQKALCVNSVVVVAAQIRWWSWRERRLIKFLSELGHEVVLVNLRPSVDLSRTGTRKKVSLPPLRTHENPEILLKLHWW